MSRVGEWEIKGIPEAVRSEQGTHSGHPVCVPVLSPAQLPLHPLEKVGFGRVVNENSTLFSDWNFGCIEMRVTLWWVTNTLLILKRPINFD
jgi:hypothetical protein